MQPLSEVMVSLSSFAFTDINLKFLLKYSRYKNWEDTGKYENENKIHSTLTFVWLLIGICFFEMIYMVCMSVCERVCAPVHL